MELFLIYAWFKIDAVLWFFWVCWLAYALAIGILFTCFSPEVWDAEEIKATKVARLKKFRFRYISWICFAAFLTIIPDSKQVAILVGSSYALDFAKSTTGQKVKSLILQKAENILDQELKNKK